MDHEIEEPLKLIPMAIHSNLKDFEWAMIIKYSVKSK
jgi:hypothetical protein